MGQAQQRLFETTETTTSQGAQEASTILLNRNLFSSYYLGTLFEKAVRAHQGETGTRMPGSVRERLQRRWDKYTPKLGNLSSYADTREAWLEALFRELGYEPLEKAEAADFSEPALPDGYFLYRPASDVLATPSGDSTSADDDDDEHKDHAVLISLLSWGMDFDRPFTSRTRRGDVPHKLMERLLASGGPARWGILCNGRRIRLLKRDVVAGRQHYFEVDLEALFENHDERDAQRKEQGFDTFWTLFRALAFQPRANGRCLLDVLDEESRKHAEGVSSRLKTSVFQAIDRLMSSLVNRADELLKLPPTDDEREQQRRALAQQALADLPALYTQSLIFLYRLLFILYAESRDLLPLDNAIYRDSYSLEPLRREIELAGAEQRYQPDAFRLWETLQALFRLIHRGCNTTSLVVPAYNGTLFDPHSTSFLQAIRVPDAALYHVLLQLSVTPPTKLRGQERIDYRDLGVEQLGAVYEGLLEFEPRVATEPMVEVRYKDVRVIIPQREQREYKVERVIATGDFYLGRGAGRKMSGSYYTPQPLVDFLVRRTLEPLVQPHIQNGEPERILELKVLDPAMGSGAFLVGACLYLADAYARAVRRQEMLIPTGEQDDEAESRDANPVVQSGEAGDDLAEEATRPYRRLVAERCLYGVDLNPMAVELAKVSLWLTTLAGDKPLTFLDANLRYGNSLIGAPLHLAGHGQEDLYTIYTIHPEANKRLVKQRGDTQGARGGKRAKDLWSEEEEEEGAKQYTIYDELDDLRQTMPSLVDHRSMIAQQPSDTVAQVHEKAEIFKRQVVDNRKRQMLEQICNLWVASWFWKQPHKLMKPDEPGWVPPLDGLVYTELVSAIRQQYQEGPGLFVKLDPIPYLSEVRRIVKEVRPFHYELEFPELYFESDGSLRANAGFSAILANPPWDIVKPNSREFFTAYDPGFRELERVQAEQRQEELLKDAEVRLEWDGHVHNLDGQVAFSRLSDLYAYQSDLIDGKQTGGDANTYKLFLERAYNLLQPNGNCGIIVPSGLYTDQGGTGLRKLFLKRAQISHLICFENRRGIFPIDSRFKFVLFGMRKAPSVEQFDAAFMLHDLSVLSSPQAYTIEVPTQLIERFSPDTSSVMEFRSQQDVDVVAKIYSNWPLLGESVPGAWSINLSREFDMTNNRRLFNTENNGWPLYEGKMIHQYTHRFSEARYWVDEAKGREELARMEIQRVEEKLDTLAIELGYVRKTATRKERVKNLLASYGRGPLTADDVRIDPEASRLAIRTVARNTDERTVISTVVPSQVFAGNSLIYLIPWHFDEQQAIKQLHDIKSCYKPSLPAPVLAYLCGALNSFALDYVIRFKVSANVNMFYVYQLPVPRLTPTDPHCRAIAHRVARLVCVGPEFDELRKELLRDVNAHVATIEDERQRLKNEIDALVAHLYGLSEDDLHHILYADYTFTLVKKEIEDGVMREFARVEALLREEQ